MAQPDFKRIRKTITINTVIQVFLVVLLVIAAIKVQQGLVAQGRPHRFLHSVYVTIALQLVLFFPLSKAAGAEVERELAGSEPGLSAERLQELRRKRIFAEFMKAAVFVFFVTFILRAPGDLFIQGMIFFSFLLTTISYLQCFNFTAKRRMSGGR